MISEKSKLNIIILTPAQIHMIGLDLGSNKTWNFVTKEFRGRLIQKPLCFIPLMIIHTLMTISCANNIC